MAHMKRNQYSVTMQRLLLLHAGALAPRGRLYEELDAPGIATASDMSMRNTSEVLLGVLLAGLTRA